MQFICRRRSSYVGDLTVDGAAIVKPNIAFTLHNL